MSGVEWEGTVAGQTHEMGKITQKDNVLARVKRVMCFEIGEEEENGQDEIEEAQRSSISFFVSPGKKFRLCVKFSGKGVKPCKQGKSGAYLDFQWIASLLRGEKVGSSKNRTEETRSTLTAAPVRKAELPPRCWLWIWRWWAAPGSVLKVETSGPPAEAELWESE